MFGTFHKDAFKQFRGQLGLTQNELAHEMHCSTSSVKAWEAPSQANAHPSAPMVDRLYHVAAEHGCDFSHLPNLYSR